MGRRFLLMRSSSSREVSILWLDDPENCKKFHADKDGRLWKARYHFFRDKAGLAWTFLCPDGLEKEEWDRVDVDNGDWAAKLRTYRAATVQKRPKAFEDFAQVGGGEWD